MALPILKPTDFVGEVAISSNQFDEKNLMIYIERYEKELLEELVGCQMATDLIANLDGNNVPVDAKYTYIWNAFCDDDSVCVNFMYQYGYFYSYHHRYTGHGCKVQWRSRGIKEYLKYQIYFLYTRYQQVKNTSVGNVKNDLNVSKLAANSASNMRNMHNSSLDWYWAIQWRICKNANDYDYDDYNGIRKQSIGLI